MDKNSVLEALKVVVDPEIGIDIVSLGFIYDVSITENLVKIRMTLSSPGCPVGGQILSEVEETIKSKYNVNVEIDLTFDPMWSPDNLSSEAKEKMGLFDF